jgi:Fe-S cluster assembly protein SufD
MIAEEAHYTDHNTDPAMWHLSNMFFRDGVAIDVAPGVHVAEPMEILLVCDEENALYNVHTAIRIGANASLTIIEDHRGTGTFWKNRLSHIRLEPGARLTHIRLQRDSSTAVYTQTTKIEIAGDAHYEAVGLYTGARLSRNQVHAVLKEAGGTAHINGINLMRGEQHTDSTILIEHRAPHCASRQNFRSVLDDRAHGVFQGKVHVHQPAQKTDGYQLSKAILLSEGAEMHTKPELEIYADDVKCSHGATTGQLDEEPVFYMRSRGIEEDAARALMIESFCADALETVEDEGLKERLMDEVRAWLT